MWQGFSPSATRNFITERCSSNKESMIDETPIIYQRAKYCVYRTIIENRVFQILVEYRNIILHGLSNRKDPVENKLTTVLANECSFHQYIMCVYSCMWNLKREA
jgi:hypothetical protein